MKHRAAATNGCIFTIRTDEGKLSVENSVTNRRKKWDFMNLRDLCFIKDTNKMNYKITYIIQYIQR